MRAVAPQPPSLALLALVALVPALAACIDGARIEGPIPPDFLGPPPEDVATGDATGDVADAKDPDAADVPDAGADVPDVPDVPDEGGDVPCTPGEPGCDLCAGDGDCVHLDDGNLCNGRMKCVEGTCVADPTVPDCSEAPEPPGPCFAWACDPPTGTCRKLIRPDEGACDDGDVCTAGERCEGGVCIPGKRLQCDDGNPCTEDTCFESQCAHATKESPCDDGNPCTSGDQCQNGKCFSGASVCACAVDADCAVWDDGDACNGTHKCNKGKCVNIGAVFCDQADAGPCELNACDPANGKCATAPKTDGVGCNDGDRCTWGDSCAAGACAGTPAACTGVDCVLSQCDPDNGRCQLVPDPAKDGEACAAAGPCFEGATCAAGGCVPDALECACSEDADCAPQDDADLCNGKLACVEGRCVPDPGSLPVCPPLDDPLCQVHSCDPATGACTVEAKEDGTSCDDRDPCTGADACAAGSCTGTAASCGGADLCLDAVCNPFAGCALVPLGVSCAPPDLCISQAGCAGGQCLPIVQASCPAGGPCVEAGCDPATGKCTADFVVATCDDGDDCTFGDVCQAGACAGAPVICDDGDPCTAEGCGAGGDCTSAPAAGAVCDDGNLCTIGDECSPGGECVGTKASVCSCGSAADCAEFEDGNACNGTLTCAGGQCAVDPATVVSCDTPAGDPCQVNACDPATGTCALQARPDGLACEDSDPCTVFDVCQGGQCVGTGVDCTDGNDCTDDTCAAGTGCAHAPVVGSVECDDGSECTVQSACSAGVCDSKPNLNICACLSDTDCAEFEDGDLCNGTFVCEKKKCVVKAGTQVVCQDHPDPCIQVACEPATGDCVESEVEEASCEDGDPCTEGDACAGGACQPGAMKGCDDGEACRTGACDPETGECAYTAKPGPCDDGNPCTAGDLCSGGECVGANQCACSTDAQCTSQPQFQDKCLGKPVCGLLGCELKAGSAVVCPGAGGTPCDFFGCNPATGKCQDFVLGTGEACDDGDACTTGTTCDAAGQCKGTTLDCDDGLPCTSDVCDVDFGCIHTPLADGDPCDDGDECSTNDKCTSGKCNGKDGGSNLPKCKCDGGSPSVCPPISDPCNGVFQCIEKKCVRDPPVVCPGTANACTPKECVAATGLCKDTAKPNGFPCDDKQPCTGPDACASGFCKGTPITCDDGDPCTADACSGGACSNTALAPNAACDDGDPCTKGEKCQATGECAGGSDACKCTKAADCGFLDKDANPCNGFFDCVAEVCTAVADPIADCEDPDATDCLDPTCVAVSATEPTCELKPRQAGLGCDDGDACTEGDLCKGGPACEGVVAKACTDTDPFDCVVSACDPALAACLPVVLADGTSCSDGTDCTTGDACVSGGCHGKLTSCDDGEECTVDLCVASKGCVHEAATGPCDDSDPCTEGTSCEGGSCGGGTAICGACDDDIDCEAFDDGDACTGVLICKSKKCVLGAGTIVTCPESANPCTENVCAGGTCDEVPRADNLLCDDGDPCTSDDRCTGGACEGTADSCNDGEPCTIDSCAPATGDCTYALLDDGEPCADADPCNGGETCQGGVCTAGEPASCPCASDADCAPFEDGDPCNGSLVCNAGGECAVNPASVVTCPLDPTGCAPLACSPGSGLCEASIAADGKSCSDGDSCTIADACDGGECGGIEVACQDEDPCTESACVPGVGCVDSTFSGPCDDGDPCTEGDVCLDGDCTGDAVDCDDAEPCTLDSCDSDTGACVHTPVDDELFLACDDGDACTGGGVCGGGSCQADPICGCDTAIDCPSQDDFCAVPYACEGGSCVPDPEALPPCPPDGETSTPCAIWSCDPATGECVFDAKEDGEPCDDGSLCTEGDVCEAGVCSGDPVLCGDLGPCLVGQCVPSVGCELGHSLSAPCDDIDPCTTEDQCLEGKCVGSTPAPPSDSFDDGDLSDWTFEGPEGGPSFHLSGTFAASEPLSLAALDRESGTMAWDGGAWLATATRAAVHVPAGATAATVRFKLHMDVAPGCETEFLRVVVDGALMEERCDPTGEGFVAVTVPLGQVAGQEVEVSFEVGETTGEGSTGAGVFVDDVAFDWECGAP